jgi:hypothetical protein
MQPTTSSKITLHCSTSKGNFSFKGRSVQLHYSKIGQKKFTQSTSYLSIEFSLTFGQTQTLIRLGDASLSGHQSALWLSYGQSEFDLPRMSWKLVTRPRYLPVHGIYTTGSPINLRIDISAHLDLGIGFLRNLKSDGIRAITGMNAEFRDAFNRRVTGRLLKECDSPIPQKDWECALM